MQRRHLPSLACVGLLLGACADASTSPPSEDAALGWRSTQLAMSEAGLQLVPSDASASGSVDSDGASGMATGSFACPDGGTLDVMAEGQVDEDIVAGRLQLEFHDCGADGVSIDGVLDYEGVVEETTVTGSISGLVTWSGAVEGECIIDVSAEVSNSGASGSVSLEGDVCGHAWTEIAGG